MVLPRRAAGFKGVQAGVTNGWFKGVRMTAHRVCFPLLAQARYSQPPAVPTPVSVDHSRAFKRLSSMVEVQVSVNS